MGIALDKIAAGTSDRDKKWLKNMYGLFFQAYTI